MALVIGVDESGTGAWAGPFHVCGVLVDDSTFGTLVPGLNDSKQLSDKKRRSLVPLIAQHALGVFPFVGSVELIKKFGQREVWRMGIRHVVVACRTRVHDLRSAAHHRHDGTADSYPPSFALPVIIDGPEDEQVKLTANGEQGIYKANVRWEPKADGKYPVVMAASIVAKTLRNDAMIALHERHPDYDWFHNAGYGTPRHQAGIAEHGLTEHHRPIKGIENLVRGVPCGALR